MNELINNNLVEQIKSLLEASRQKIAVEVNTTLLHTYWQIGKYGRMHLDHIKNHRRGRYTTLLTEGKLNARLHEIDLEANEMLETIIPRLTAERGIDENMKARDMLRWVAEMNNIKASAEEIVLREVVLV